MERTNRCVWIKWGKGKSKVRRLKIKYEKKRNSEDGVPYMIRVITVFLQI